MSETNDTDKLDDLQLDEPVLSEEPPAAEADAPKADAAKADSPKADSPKADAAEADAAKTDGDAPQDAKEEASKTDGDASAKTKGEAKAEGEGEKPAKPERKLEIKAWIRASRPTYFVATLVPLFLGYFAAAVYDGVSEPRTFALIVAASFLVHLAANLSNDLFDHAAGVDDAPGAIGGSRVIQEGRISPAQIKTALLVCYLAAFALAVIIVGTDKLLWGLVLFAAFSSFFYVCPPIKYGRRGLGEVFVFVNMGLIMTAGTHLALTGGPLDLRIISLALPVALGVANILFFQSLPEIETDAKAGKRTLAGILGKERSALAQLLWWPLIWLLMINLWLTGLAAWPALLGVVTLPMHLFVIHKIGKAKDDWLSLDKHGLSVRFVYLVNGILLILGVMLLPQAPAEIVPTAPAAVTAPTPAAVTAPNPTPAAVTEEAAPAETPAAPAEQPAAPAEPPAAPAEQPATPAEQPAAPAEQPATPAEQPAAPAEQPAAPAEQPAAPAETPAPPAETPDNPAPPRPGTSLGTEPPQGELEFDEQLPAGEALETGGGGGRLAVVFARSVGV
ncbi:MAG: prenyltransferase [Deltaproteobacteria bacterium]|jgi:1,4-dihydroxy-2-naphthoate octaprenyltransferase|nr:prenyltransferase [Deltaproteobacteria bacterium]